MSSKRKLGHCSVVRMIIKFVPHKERKKGKKRNNGIKERRRHAKRWSCAQ